MASIAVGLLGAAPTLIQGVASLVHGIESLFGKGTGSAKKAAVLSAFNGAVQAYSGVAGALPGVKLPQMSGAAETAFGKLVDAIVGFYNATGIFQTGSTSTAKS